MKSKKLITMITALAVGSTLLVSTGFAAMAQTSGYDLYKTSVKNAKGIKNATAKLTVAVSDNDVALLTVDSTMKMDKDKNAMSSTTEEKTAGFDKTQSMYQQDGKSIMKSSDSDVYTVNDHGTKKVNRPAAKQDNTAVTQSIEGLVDAIVGNRQSKFDVKDNNDGTKTVTLNLTENDITPIEDAALNVAFSLSQAHRYTGDAATTQNSAKPRPDFKAIIPQLKDNIKVKEVDITANIDSSNNIISQDAKVIVTGNDEASKTHTVAVDVTADLSNINSTTPDTVDLTGKTVKTITAGFRSRR